MLSEMLAFRPALTPVLRNRKSSLVIMFVTATHVTLTGLGLPSWQCPFRYGVGIPCPGCGLSRAVDALIHGDWQHALHIHAYAPVLMAGLIVISAASILPDTLRTPLLQFIENLEKKTNLVVFLLLGLIVYWLIRLLFNTEELYKFVM